MLMKGCDGNTLNTVASQQHDSGFDSVAQLGSFYACTPRALWDSSVCYSFHTQAKDMQVKSAGYTELSTGANVGVNDWSL